MNKSKLAIKSQMIFFHQLATISRGEITNTFEMPRTNAKQWQKAL